MLNNLLIIVPARGGSKGIPKKNIRLFAGKPLLAWTAEIATQIAKEVRGRALLSTDSKEIAKVGKRYGLEVPFLRPANLAADDTPIIEVIIDLISRLKTTEAYKAEHIVLLQPTSPLRTKKDVKKALELYVDSGYQPVVSIRIINDYPEWAFKMRKNGKIIPLYGTSKIPCQRQKIKKAYYLNGAVYVASSKYLKKHKTFISADTLGYCMDRRASLDIDDECDWMIAEHIKLRLWKE